MKIKVKRQLFNCKPALTIFVSDVTKKILGRIENMKNLEFQQQAQQAEGYTATINHEMRTPLASMLFLLRHLINSKDIKKKLSPE